MPPKRGGGGSSEKTPISPKAKRTRLSDDSSSQGVAVATTAAPEAVASTTAPGDLSVEDDPDLMLDYNESTPVPSPRSGDEDSELMRHCNDDENLIAATSLVPVSDSPNVAVVSQPTDNKAVESSSKDGNLVKGETKLDEIEQKPRSITRDRVESKPSHAEWKAAMAQGLSRRCLHHRNGLWRMGPRQRC